MRNKIVKNIIYTMIITAISMVITLVFYSSIPSTITFINSKEVSKDFFVFILPIVSILLGIVLSFLPLIYHVISHGKIEMNTNNYHYILIIILGSILFMQVIAIVNWMDYKISLYSIAIVLLGFLVSFIGNFMPRTKKGQLLAFYNPWTIANDKVWNKTHRFGGYVWLIAGMVIIFMVLVPNTYNLWIVILILALCIITPNMYSVICYKKNK